MKNLKQSSVGRQVLFTFGTLCAILFIIGVLFFFSLRSIERNNQGQFRAMNKLAEIDDTGQDAERLQSAVLRQLLASDIVQIKQLDQTVRDIWNTNVNNLDDYRQFVDTESEKSLFDRIMQARKTYWEQTQPVLALGLSNRDSEATELIISNQSPAFNKYLQAINDLTDHVETDANNTAKETTRFISEIRIIGDALIGVAILVAIGTAFAVVAIGRRLKEDNRLLQNEVAERRRIEEALKEAQALYHSLVDQMPAGVFRKDAEDRFVFVNSWYCRIKGMKPEQILGKTPQELAAGEFVNHPESAKEIQLAVQGANNHKWIMETGKRIDVEEQYPGADGKIQSWQVVKSPVFGPDEKIIGTQGIFFDITERIKAEESVRLLGSAVGQSKESIVITDAQLDLPGPKIIFVNPAFTQMTGYTAAEVIGKTPRILQGPLTDKIVLARLRKNLENGEAFAGEAINYRKDGTEFDLEWQIAPLRDGGGKITHFVAIQRDITERKHLEAQLFQSQKMETVGKLAGGIAHEFNSILTAIIGQSELMLGDLPPGNPLVKSASEIHKAAERAAVLTRQLLAYGRKQILQPEILDLNAVVTGMENTLLHLMGRSVEVRFNRAAGLKSVKADMGQIEQVIVNIAMNATEAMPNGGKLMLETANVTLNANYVSSFPELKAGEYVMLAITDTGAGMSEAIKARIFEPFFTTKGVGKGTGLGLATCHGIIKQSGGHIAVYSELGRGTTFKIYLPQVGQEMKPPVQSKTPSGLPRGAETILLVEDDPSLREMAGALLKNLGYTVLAASNGVEAMGLVHQQGRGHIDLLFTDVVMPHMSGKELADRVHALHPQTKILFTSAYTENAIVHQGVLNKGVALLQKPFTPSVLANKLREVLDKPDAPEPDGAQKPSGFSKNRK